MRLPSLPSFWSFWPVSAPVLRRTAWISGLGNTNNTTEVRVEVAEEGDLVESVSAPGWIEPVLQVALSAEVSAKVIEVLIDEEMP